MIMEFDINKVKILWDFSPISEPLVLFTYVDNGNIWIIGKCDRSEGVVGVDELKKMWERTTSPEAVKEYQEQIKRMRKGWRLELPKAKERKLLTSTKAEWRSRKFSG